MIDNVLFSMFGHFRQFCDSFFYNKKKVLTKGFEDQSATVFHLISLIDVFYSNGRIPESQSLPYLFAILTR